MHPRRIVTVPGYAFAWILCVGGAPLWLPVCALIDAVRGKTVALRCACFLTVFFTFELVGLAISAALLGWKLAARPGAARWRAAHQRLQNGWGSALFGAVVHVFGLRVEVKDEAELARGPYVLLVRHSSTADTLLASALVCVPHGIDLRYVLKQELLWDPCLDVVGSRLGHLFVDRSGADSAREIARVRSLAAGLGPHEGLLIYPEGTRFSAAKQARVRERLRQAGDASALAAAEALTAVLPPRAGGVLAALEAAPDADVIFCVHAGFEGTASLAQIWRGELVGRTVRVGFWRVPRAGIPRNEEGTRAWLRSEWQRVDDWVLRHQQP